VHGHILRRYPDFLFITVAEIIVQLADAAQGTVPFQCTTMRDAGHRENNKTINEEGGGWHEGFFVQVDSSFSESFAQSLRI